jgi:hypothetical protein
MVDQAQSWGHFQGTFKDSDMVSRVIHCEVTAAVFSLDLADSSISDLH